MNILELTGMSSNKYGGLERYFVRLVESDRLDNFIFVYDKNPQSNAYISDLTQVGGTICIFSSAKKWSYFRFVCDLIKKKNIDIVHFHFGSYWLAPLLRCFNPKLKIIATCHCEIKINNIIRRLERRFYQCAFDKIICVSHGVKKGLIENVGPSSKYDVLYLGVEKRPIQHFNLRDALGYSSNSVVLTTIGFSIRIKGLDILIHAVKYLVENFQLSIDFNVLIIGVNMDSEEGLLLKELINNAKLSNVVKSVGITNDIDDFLNISDIYLQPSRTEAISLSIMEALGYGLPVVATRVGGIPEVVHDGVNGFLFENGNYIQLADKLHKLIVDRVLRLEMGKQSLLLSKNYTLQKNLDCFIKYIRNI